MRKIGKAVAAVALAFFLSGLFGCSKAPEYTVEDIRSVSISCGHMDNSRSYSFYLRKIEGCWMLDAEFAADTEHPRVAYEACPVTEEDAGALLDIVREQEVLETLRRWTKPKIRLRVSDETVYHTSVLLADGKQLTAATRISADLEACFYRLAEKYRSIVSETDRPSAD